MDEVSAKLLCLFKSDQNGTKEKECHITKSDSPLELLEHHKVDFAIVGSDKLSRLDDNGSDLNSIAALYKKVLYFVVNPKSNISSIKDIKTRDLHIGYDKNTTDILLQTICKKLDINISKLLATDTNQSASMLKNHKIDGFLSLAPNPSRVIRDKINKTNGKLLQIAGKPFNQLIRDNNFILKSQIKKGTFQNQENDIVTLGVKSVLVTSGFTDRKKIYSIADTIIKNIDKFKNIDPIYKNISKKDLLEELVLPQHKSAIKAFNGLKLDDKL